MTFVKNMQKPELLSPIQDFTSLQAAIQGGADAVYFGIRGFNMRAGAKNFTVADLKKITKICHDNNIKAYLALNIIIYESELNKLKNLLKKAKLAKIDAIICWDMAVIELVKKYKLELHISTQASIANSKSAEFYKRLGASRVILARECSLSDIKKINKKIKINLEVFIHGAMCVSVSGRCFLSQFKYNKSANRGECLQPCRRKYLIKEIDGKNEYEIDEDYVLSPKDLCTLPFIEKLIKLDVASFKIEGRNRSPEYVKTVTSVYREAIDFYFDNYKNKNFNNNFNKLKNKLLKKLNTVYNRKFSDGFYLGKPINEWSHSYGSQASEKKIHIGTIKHFYNKISVAEIKIQANKKLNINNNILIQGPTTGVVKQKINSLEINHKKIKNAKQGDIVAIKIDELVRTNDEVYKIIKK